MLNYFRGLSIFLNFEVQVRFFSDYSEQDHIIYTEQSVENVGIPEVASKNSGRAKMTIFLNFEIIRPVEF